MHHNVFVIQNDKKSKSLPNSLSPVQKYIRSRPKISLSPIFRISKRSQRRSLSPSQKHIDLPPLRVPQPEDEREILRDLFLCGYELVNGEQTEEVKDEYPNVDLTVRCSYNQQYPSNNHNTNTNTKEERKRPPMLGNFSNDAQILRRKSFELIRTLSGDPCDQPFIESALLSPHKFNPSSGQSLKTYDDEFDRLTQEFSTSSNHRFRSLSNDYQRQRLMSPTKLYTQQNEPISPTKWKRNVVKNRRKAQACERCHQMKKKCVRMNTPDGRCYNCYKRGVVCTLRQDNRKHNKKGAGKGKKPMNDVASN